MGHFTERSPSRLRTGILTKMKEELVIGYITILLIHTTVAWSISSLGGDDSGSLGDERKLLNLLKDVKSRRKQNTLTKTDWYKALCGKWDDWCVPDSNKPGLSCCESYTCKCNLWNTNCRCKSKLFNG